eukprot:gene1796-3485_t
MAVVFHGFLQSMVEICLIEKSDIFNKMEPIFTVEVIVRNMMIVSQILSWSIVALTRNVTPNYSQTKLRISINIANSNEDFQLTRDLLHGISPHKYTRDEQFEKLSHRVCTCFVAREEEFKAIIGCLDITTNSRQDLQIKNLFVDEKFRKQGVGKKLLIEALNYSYHIKKATYVYLDVESENRVAQRLYESIGFKKMSKTLLSPLDRMKIDLV